MDRPVCVVIALKQIEQSVIVCSMCWLLARGRGLQVFSGVRGHHESYMFILSVSMITVPAAATIESIFQRFGEFGTQCRPMVLFTKCTGSGALHYTDWQRYKYDMSPFSSPPNIVR